ncbi:GlxA family transcriptional regulator [Paraburkholderia bonniea]|uniref:GlxA family transcriptional regulator n=1 Tax=Paraburkholderia bonniea TaxID=2152891 RepID=UPI001292BB79|nr:GlxA family transcriptional regulator [Paraburkholderia bonniea]WJF92126.1 GlxA family transcriptional regulator [Paraburkholderia bonniea]WJF95446.1 GlxA family transcriptional regulator [Paraburkholderia bonniea]
METELASIAAIAAESPVPGMAHFGFLALPAFSLIALSSAIEVLRMANYVGRAQHYRWSIFTPDGAPAVASNGITLKPARSLGEAAATADLPDVLIVCGGMNIRQVVDARLIRQLNHAAGWGVPLGGICTGAYALMAAGLLSGYRCTVHWENLSALHREFPQVMFAEELFVIDRDRMTCTGGTAPLDLMLYLVTERLGKGIATQVSEQFIVERIRGANDSQPIPIDARVGFSRAELIEVVRLMEANIDEPLSLEELARLVQLSQRHLQRMFKLYLGVSPTHYYLALRLRRARDLLRTTGTSIADVTAACGFHSACHFSKAYRTQFGHAPSTERRQSEVIRAMGGGVDDGRDAGS